MNREPQIKHDLEPESLTQKLPEGPGVYIFKDNSDQIIYVGKAKSLKKRVSAYLKPLNELTHKTALMMNRAKRLDYILTATEKEAFILEDILVKRHMPRYNIVLRDDKRYPCLRLDVQNPFPRLSIVRRMKKDGALYFGPFSSANAVRSTLRLIDRIFLLRKCKGQALPKRSRPCLNYQLGRCLGACVRQVTSASYKEIVEQVRLFLEGRNRELIKQLRKNMDLASEQLDFEKAARIRDQIGAVEATIERQNVVSPKMEDQDIVNRVCFLLEKKQGLIKGYLSLTERIKEIIGNNIDKSKIHAFLYKRGDCINNIDMIDGSIKKLIKAINSDKDYRASERLREAIDPYLKGIRNLMKRISRMDSELLVIAREETGHLQTELLQMGKFRQGMHGYRKGKNISPRFLDTVE